MFVGMCDCMYVCVQAFVFVGMCDCMYVCVHVCVIACTCACKKAKKFRDWVAAPMSDDVLEVSVCHFPFALECLCVRL